MVVHADAAGDEDGAAARVTGRLTVRSCGGARRTLPCTTDGRSAAVASLRVVAKWRHEPVR